jgi:ATP-binding cassette subfamily B (MDR/TAP) protein 9
LIFSVITSGLRGFIFSVTSTNLIQRLRNLLFASIVKQDIEFFDETKTGEITSRLTSDITTVGEAVSVNLNVFLRSIVQISKYSSTKFLIRIRSSSVLVGTIVMMLVLSWNLFLLVLITGPLAFGTAKLYGDLMAVNKEFICSEEITLFFFRFRINRRKCKMH